MTPLWALLLAGTHVDTSGTADRTAEPELLTFDDPSPFARANRGELLDEMKARMVELATSVDPGPSRRTDRAWRRKTGKGKKK